MKLFLTSLASETLDLIIPILSSDPKKLNVAFIATAADPYIGEKMPWMDDDKAKLKEMFGSVIDYDLKHKNIEILRRDLSRFQIIFVSGGNSFYLLNEVKKSGFDIVIKELLAQGIIYIGASAGSTILGPDISHLTTVDHPEIVSELRDYSSLGLIKERILPHYGREKYVLRHAELMKKWGNDIFPLRDDQALVVNGDKIEVVTK